MGTPQIIMPSRHCCLKINNKYVSPKRTKIQPPNLSRFQAKIVTPKALRVISKCIKESYQPNPGLNPSKMNIARKATINIDKILGK